MTITRRPLFVLGALAIVAATGIAALAHNGSAPRPISPSSTTQVAAAAPLVTLAAATTTNSVTVVGDGTGLATPDQAVLSIGVQATRPDVRSAVAAMTAEMNKLNASLKSSGVAAKDIQTTGISVYQATTCCPNAVSGYIASQSLNVTVHHLNNVSSVIAAAVDAVGNDIQLNGVNLFVGDPNPAIKAARAAAMADANARAQEWARLSGHHVGGLISLAEAVVVQPGVICTAGCGGRGGAGGGPSVQPGQTTYEVTITATYELLP